MTQSLAITKSTFRFAGWCAVVSGVIGIAAFVCLMTAVTSRSTIVLSMPVYIMFRAHDVGIILQYILLIPVAIALYKLSQQKSLNISPTTLNITIGALLFIVAILLLVFPKILHDDYYLFPQGIFGVCLILINWRLNGLLPGWLRWFGMVVGLGLTFVGIYPIGYAIFVDTTPFRIPAVELTTSPDTPANNILHQIIYIGTFMGVLPLPFWTILLSIRLLRKKSFSTSFSD